MASDSRRFVILIALALVWGVAQTAQPETAPQAASQDSSRQQGPSRLDPSTAARRGFGPPGSWDAPALAAGPSSEGLAQVSDQPEQSETLEQAWAAALAVDPRLQSKQWEVSSANQSLYAARAQRWPAVALETSYTVRSAEPSFRFDVTGLPLATNTFPYAQDESYALRAKIGVPLFTSGRIRHGIAAAQSGASAAGLDAQAYRSDLLIQVAEEYVTVLRAQRDLEVAQSSVRSLEAHARDVQLLYDNDRVPKSDLLSAQVALSNARQLAIRANRELDAGRAAYNRRLARPLTAPVRIAELPPDGTEQDVDALTARALGRRPEMGRIAAQIRAMRYQASSQRARSNPQVEVRGEYAFDENRYQTPNGIAGVGVVLGWNLFDGGRNRHEAAALSDRAAGLAHVRADIESAIRLEVRRAWLEVQETRQRVGATRAAIQEAEENLRVMNQRYSAGRALNTEVLEAETLRSQAYRNHYDATFDAALAALRLEHATGSLR